MIPEEKMVQLAKALLEKTRNHEANWRPDPLYDLSYILQLPGSRIRVAMERMPDVPDRVPTFTLTDLNDVTVGVLEARDPAIGMIVANLYQQASKVATRWDKVLEEVETALNQKGLIGSTGK